MKNYFVLLGILNSLITTPFLMSTQIIQRNSFRESYTYINTYPAHIITPDGQHTFFLSGINDLSESPLLTYKSINQQEKWDCTQAVTNYHERGISQITFGNRIFSIERTLNNGHKQIHFYTNEGGKELGYSNQEGPIEKHFFISDTRYIVVQQNDSTLQLHVFDLETLDTWDTLTIEQHNLISIEPHSDNIFIIRHKNDNNSNVQHLAFYKVEKDCFPDGEETCFINHIKSLYLSPLLPNLIISPSSHKKIQFSRGQSGTFNRLLVTTPIHLSCSLEEISNDNPCDIFSHTEEEYVVIRTKNTISVYQTNNNETTLLYSFKEALCKNITCLTISHDNETFCCGTNNGFVHAFNLRDGKPKGHLYIPNPNDQHIEKIQFSRDNHYFLVTPRNRGIVYAFEKQR